MKVSAISTVYNEESSVEEFLDSLLLQSRKPDEIVIVDGGSTDRTAQIIREYSQKEALIKLIVKKGANISQGRNIAIKNVKYEIIASTDAGCRLDKDWLKNIMNEFDDDTDVVGGNTIPDPKSEFEKCVVEVTMDKQGSVNGKDFLPSSRSIAFRKSAWKAVGGYPEYLYTAEDTIFDINLRKAGYKFRYAADAKVYWKVRSKLRSVFKQHYLYSKGNAEAGLYNLKNFFNRFLDMLGLVIILIILPFLDLYLLPFWLILLAIIYRPYISSGFKCYILHRKLTSLLYGVVLKLTLDVSIFVGMILGGIKIK